MGKGVVDEGQRSGAAGPVEPNEETGPFESVGLAGQVGPIERLSPIEPGEPAGPARPDGSTIPVEPVEPAELPAWLVAPSSYEPVSDRDGFLRKNVLQLASVLVRLRSGAPSRDELGVLDRLLRRVPGTLRLVAMLVVVVCVSLTRNMAFVGMVVAGWLVMLALRPASRIRPVFMSACAAFAFAVVVNLPALLLGQTSAPLRMGAKALATVGVVASVVQVLGIEGVLASLRLWRLPSHLVMTIDLAFRDIVLLGESALSLSEALALRSVGRDRTKTGSAAGVMGVTFLHAQTRATARAEAMELRGYGAAVPTSAQVGHPHLSLMGLAYSLFLAGIVALFVYLEVSLS